MPIPASQLVSIAPSVLSAGGSGLDMLGLALSESIQVPIGEVLAFPDAPEVADYFGDASPEAAFASTYFKGFNGCTRFPDFLLFTQYPGAAVYPYLRGGDASGIPLTTLQGYSGVMAVTVNGLLRTSAAINLASAVSPSSAAGLIQTAFNSFDAVTGSNTSIAAGTATSVVGTIVGNVLTVTHVNSGTLVVGGVLSGTGGGGVAVGTTITGLLAAGTGGTGTYTVSQVQNVASTTITQSYALMTVNSVASGTLAVGQLLSGTGGLAANTSIASLAGGTGGTGTYVLSGGAQTIGATTISAGPLTVTYDSVSGGFIITGGTPGSGTITQASGAIATNLLLTTVTGAVLSQGAAAATPGPFMNGVITETTNWATFTTLFDPDAYGNANKLLFSRWTDSTDDAYMYVGWDTDITPTLSQNAPTSLGQLLAASEISGTNLNWAPTAALGIELASFVCGMVASIDFEATNGRITLAYKGLDGLDLTVTDAETASNLIANGYNFYGQYAARNQLFNFYQNGSVSGSFAWADSFVDQIWLNNELQLDLLTFLQNSKSVPYNQTGYGSIEAVIGGGAAAKGLNNGVITAGVELSAGQIIEVNQATGLKIDGILSTRGWYAQVQPASAQVRGQRGSPPSTFWYTDGGSIQKIDLASVEVQ